MYSRVTWQDLPYNAGEYEFESGQMVIDRARAWDALLVAAEINRRYVSYYRFMCAHFICFLALHVKVTRAAGTATRTPFASLLK